MKVLASAAVFVLACSSSSDSADNPGLGMTTISVVESANRTTVSGWNADGSEIARLEGTHPIDCSGKTTCPLIFGEAANSCGGANPPVAATAAWSVHQRADAGYRWDYREGEVQFDQSIIAQCCPPVPGAVAYDFFAKKACPDRRDCSLA